MSPSPTPRHNHIAGEIYYQLRVFLNEHPIGIALMETDAHLGAGVSGRDLVYRAEVIFVERRRLPKDATRPLQVAPNLMVEVVSDSSRRYDMTTKFLDYQRCGVHEYWVIDADREAMKFFRLVNGKYKPQRATAGKFRSKAVAGFALDLKAVRAALHPW